MEKETDIMAKKFVYFFGDSKAEGDASMKLLLGGKGANLAEMVNLKIPVPAGFTISTDSTRRDSKTR
jgi:pyruvate,orthophosphate dikinase